VIKKRGETLMVQKKEKKDKIILRPKNKNQVTNQRPTDIWTDMDRLFDEFRSNFDDIFWPYEQRSKFIVPTPQIRTPPMDIADKGDRYELRLEMPGIPKENVDIQVTPNTIEIKAECEESTEEKDERWLHKECRGMSFYRSLEIPDELQTDKVNAELKHGVLYLNLPKMEPKPEYKAKKIQIK